MKNLMKKLMIERAYKFHKSNHNDCELIVYSWFNHEFTVKLTKNNNNNKINVICYDENSVIVSNYSIEDSKSSFEKVINDTLIFIKEDQYKDIINKLYQNRNNRFLK